VIGGQHPQSVPILPSITNNIDWTLRLTESGPSASIIQKYIDRPLLTPTGKQKMIFRMSVFLKSVVPLQCYVSKKVQVLHALKSFTMGEGSLGDEQVHLCQQTAADTFFEELDGHDALLGQAAESVRHVLLAF